MQGESTALLIPKEEIHTVINGHVERYHPALANTPIHYHHLHRYAFAAAHVVNLRVLDLASGEGYGTAILAENAREVIGLDLNERVIEAASEKYVLDNASFQVGDMIDMPFEDESFDCIVCFEAVEHIEKQRESLKEIRRVLKQDGLLIMSSPNRERSEMEMDNPFHVHEMDREEFLAFLKEEFSNVQLMAQKITLISGIWQTADEEGVMPKPEEHFVKKAKDRFGFSHCEPANAELFIALASNAPLNRAPNSYFVDNEDQGLDEMKEDQELHRLGCLSAVRIFKEKTLINQIDRNRVAELCQDLAAGQGRVHQKEQQVNLLSRAVAAAAIQPLRAWNPRSGLRTKRISLIVPVLNGGRAFKKLLEGLLAQKDAPEVELIVPDSGSLDRSLERAEAAGARVIPIDPSQFSHGGVRDAVGRLATGEHLVFMVQDAWPGSDAWLSTLIGFMEANPDLSVLSCRQAVTDDAHLYNRIQHSLMYKFFGFDGDVSYGLGDPGMLWALDPLSRRTMTFVDNVCSCIPRDVFLEYGFRPLKNAEDIDLGARLVEGGCRLGFLNSAPVFHWHDRDPAYFLKRYFIGVESVVYLLRAEPMDLAQFDISSFEDLHLRARSVYELVKLSIQGWRDSRDLFDKGLAGYLRAFAEAMAALSAKGINVCAKGEGDASLDKILKAVFEERRDDPFETLELNANHMVLRFNNELRDIAEFMTRERIRAQECSKEFIEVLYRNAASIIGDSVGNWVLHQVMTHKESPYERIKGLMEQGVCYTG